MDEIESCSLCLKHRCSNTIVWGLFAIGLKAGLTAAGEEHWSTAVKGREESELEAEMVYRIMLEDVGSCNSQGVTLVGRIHTFCPQENALQSRMVGSKALTALFATG